MAESGRNGGWQLALQLFILSQDGPEIRLVPYEVDRTPSSLELETDVTQGKKLIRMF